MGDRAGFKEPNLILNGSGSAGGGAYRKVVIRGDGVLQGDVSCTSFACYGNSEILGSLMAGQCKMLGQNRLNGALKAGKFRLMGDLTTEDGASIRTGRLAGMVRIGGKISAEWMKLAGTIEAGGDIDAETLIVNGMLTSGGLINAESVELRMHYGDSRVREMGGERISVKRAKPFFMVWFGGWKKSDVQLQAETIEGSEIMLEYTKAKVVRGDSVTLGPGCEIDRVEYKTRFNRDSSANVRETVKT